MTNTDPQATYGCICPGEQLIEGVPCMVYSAACPQHGAHSRYSPAAGLSDLEVRTVKAWNGREAKP